MTEPSRRDRMRPLELVGLALGIAVFVGGGALLATRQWLLALEFAGGAFILSLVVLAMLLLASSPIEPGPPGEEDGDRGH